MSEVTQERHRTTDRELEVLKSRVAKAHRIIAAGGLLPLTKGHVGARGPNGEVILVLGHIHAFGRTLDTTTVEDICTMDLEGNQIGNCEAGLVGERYIHTAVLRARPEMNAVVHCHAPYATALGVAGVNVLPLGNRGGLFAPKVPILDFDGQIDSPERGEMVQEALGDAYAVVLRNHGVVTVGATVEQACIVTFALEETAKMQWIASTVGTPQPISEQETERVRSLAEDNVEFFDHVWQHYEALDPLR